MLLWQPLVHRPSTGPAALQYDGYLLERNKPVTGSRAMEVRLHSSSAGGKPVAKESIGPVKLTNGEFSFKYGGKGLATKLSAGNSWLAIAIEGKEQAPRVQLIPVPFALYSADAQQLKSKVSALENRLEELTEQLQELQSHLNDALSEDPSDEDLSDGDPSGDDESGDEGTEE